MVLFNQLVDHYWNRYQHAEIWTMIFKFVLLEEHGVLIDTSKHQQAVPG